MKQEEYASRANSPHLCSSTSLSALCHIYFVNTPLHKASSYHMIRCAARLYVARPSLSGQNEC